MSATTFTGTLEGKATTATTAATATKLGSDTLGSASTPIYLSSGNATECSKYAGGTAVTLNGFEKGASTAEFWAPTSAGTSGWILQSLGQGEPIWVEKLLVKNGGTGKTSFASGEALIGNGTGAIETRKITDNTSATAVKTGTELITANTFYYGLPKINNSHSYTSSTSIYAPTAGGTAGFVLVGNGTTSAPVWKSETKVIESLLTNGFVRRGTSLTPITLTIALSDLSTTSYTTVSTTVQAIVLGSTAAPTDSAGALDFNPTVRISNLVGNSCKISFGVKRKASTDGLFTTISLPVISIPLATS